MSSETRKIVCPHCDTINRVPLDKPAGRAKCGRCHKQMFFGKPVPVSARSFAAHIQHDDIPVAVDFWAEWCGPCKMIGPALEEISNELGQKISIVKLNIDDNPLTPAKYGVRGIPTLMLFKDGQVAATKIGALPKGALSAWVENNL
jgi:thioredoxin